MWLVQTLTRAISEESGTVTHHGGPASAGPALVHTAFGRGDMRWDGLVYTRAAAGRRGRGTKAAIGQGRLGMHKRHDVATTAMRRRGGGALRGALPVTQLPPSLLSALSFPRLRERNKSDLQTRAKKPRQAARVLPFISIHMLLMSSGERSCTPFGWGRWPLPHLPRRGRAPS